MRIKHIGINVQSNKYGLKINRENYAIINRKPTLPKFNNSEEFFGVSSVYDGELYSEEWCKKHQELALENYDLSMAFFSKLDKHEFDNAISSFLMEYPFCAVTDLNEYQCPGYYMMVLDEYKRIYIGTSVNIYNRIRQHWVNTKAFDRLLTSMVNVTTSIMSIDSFRALDTTRIYAYKTGDINMHEGEFMASIDEKYLANRTCGSITLDSQVFLDYASPICHKVDLTNS